MLIYSIYGNDVRIMEVRLVNTNKLSDYYQMYIKRDEIKEIKRK